MAKKIGAFEIVDIDLAGRIGRLHLRTATIETPAFFPVVDPQRQEVPLDKIRDAGFHQIITNAYLAYKRWGPTSRGIHGMLNWRGAVMTDSGAYQILAYGDIDVDQETILRYQKKVLKPDIGVILDIPTGDVSRERAEYTVKETLRRAHLALSVIDPTNDDILWVLPVQGGRYVDLVERSAKQGSMLPYRMYGIGSPTVFLEKYRYDTIIKIIRAAKLHLNPARPVHLFGAGHPLILPYAVALGIDTFDSASYMLYARDDRYITPYGVYRLDELDYFPCACPVCTRYTPAELRELPKQERTRLLALHNLYVISQTMRRIKQAIREGRLWELLQETARAHPAAARALQALRGSYRLLEASTPRVKPRRVKGLRAYAPESLWNPKILGYKARLLSEFLPGMLRHLKQAGITTIRLRPSLNPPDDCSTTREADEAIIFYAPYLGLIPETLCGTYPTIHIDYANIDDTVARDLSNTVITASIIALKNHFRIIIEINRRNRIGLEILSRLSNISLYRDRLIVEHVG